MVAYELISQIIAPLHKDDTGEQALTMMSIYHVKHLPVVDGDKLLGLISEAEIMANDLEKKIEEYSYTSLRPYVTDKAHIFDVLSKLAENNLTVIPVVDDENYYLGLINHEDIIKFFASTFSFREEGSILVFETTKRDYSLAEIARIVEGEKGTILNCLLSGEMGSEDVTVTLKIAVNNMDGIISGLERFGYIIKGTFVEDDFIDTYRERYDSLMNYLDV